MPIWPDNKKVQLHSRVRLPRSNGEMGTVILTDHYAYGARRAWVLWDVSLDDFGWGPGILPYRAASLEVIP